MRKTKRTYNQREHRKKETYYSILTERKKDKKSKYSPQNEII